MPRSEWMYTGDIREGINYQLRPGVELDRYARPDELVWRYLPLNRFEEVLRTSQVFFTRLSYYATCADRLEGSTPWPFADAREQLLREQGVEMAHYNVEAERFHLQMLQTVLVNCWHKREYESFPMWERYGKGGDAVAIVSTLERLITSMPDEVTVGHVDYIDFATNSSFYSNPFTRAFLKSRAYEDEREVRAAIFERPITKNERWSITIAPQEEIGHNVHVDLSTLITKVVLSPTSSQQQSNVLAAMAQEGIAAPLAHSELSQPPRY